MARAKHAKRSPSALDRIMQVRIATSIYERFQKVATAKGMSTATYVRVLMINAVESHEKGQ